MIEIFGVEAVLGENDKEDDYDYGDNYHYEERYNEEYEENDHESKLYQDHPILGKLELKSKYEILDMISLALKDSTIYQNFQTIIDNDKQLMGKMHFVVLKI